MSNYWRRPQPSRCEDELDLENELVDHIEELARRLQIIAILIFSGLFVWVII